MSAVQILRLLPESAREDSQRLEFFQSALEAVLLHPSAADKPVAVLSVAGAYRKGKSFLLNFILRYATAGEEAQRSGAWLGEGALGGFSWRRGAEADTSGILIWDTPLLVSVGGVEMALILMDTQGTFDDEMNNTDCATIFALSGMLSSVLIYNLMHNVGEDDLQHLSLFAAYGHMALEHESGRPFQSLLFLIRDWSAGSKLGFDGGDAYITRKLEALPTQPAQIQELHSSIRSFYDQVSCCLLPHPGFEATEAEGYDGHPEGLREAFRKPLHELMEALFSNLLAVKRINGQPLNGRELLTYFNSYVEVFNSDVIPEAQSVLMATASAMAANAMIKADSLYAERMEAALVAETRPYMPLAELKACHGSAVQEAVDVFRALPKLGTHAGYWDAQAAELESRLGSAWERFRNVNLDRKLSTERSNRDLAATVSERMQKELNAAYEAGKNGKAFMAETNLRSLCQTATESALTAFGADSLKDVDGIWRDFERSVSQACDVARDRIWNINMEARIRAEENDKNVATESVARYYKAMKAFAASKESLGEKELNDRHESELAAALDFYQSACESSESGQEDKIRLEATLIHQRLRDEQRTRAMGLEIDNKAALQRALNTFAGRLRSFMGEGDSFRADLDGEFEDQLSMARKSLEEALRGSGRDREALLAELESGADAHRQNFLAVNRSRLSLGNSEALGAAAAGYLRGMEALFHRDEYADRAAVQAEHAKMRADAVARLKTLLPDAGSGNASRVEAQLDARIADSVRHFLSVVKPRPEGPTQTDDDDDDGGIFGFFKGLLHTILPFKLFK